MANEMNFLTRLPILISTGVCFSVTLVSIFCSMCRTIVYTSTFNVIVQFYSSIIITAKCTYTCFHHVITFSSIILNNFETVTTPIVTFSCNGTSSWCITIKSMYKNNRILIFIFFLWCYFICLILQFFGCLCCRSISCCCLRVFSECFNPFSRIIFFIFRRFFCGKIFVYVIHFKFFIWCCWLFLI